MRVFCRPSTLGHPELALLRDTKVMVDRYGGIRAMQPETRHYRRVLQEGLMVMAADPRAWEKAVVTGRSCSPEAQSRQGFAAHAAKQIVGPVA